jgi:hypothetical protein
MWKIAVIGSVVAIFFGNPAFRHCLPVFSDHDAACAVSEELGYQLSISNLDNLDELADCIDQMKSDLSFVDFVKTLWKSGFAFGGDGTSTPLRSINPPKISSDNISMSVPISKLRSDDRCLISHHFYWKGYAVNVDRDGNSYSAIAYKYF